MNEKLRAQLANQIGQLAVLSAEQGLMIDSLRQAVKDRDDKIADLQAKLIEAERNAEQPALPIGDARPGHEGEANGVAH
jgi:hypothetical protein